ncbi:MAG: hypothetical protein ACTSQY_04820 [Candidatus Odinarchaeia archaeon]
MVLLKKEKYKKLLLDIIGYAPFIKYVNNGKEILKKEDFKGTLFETYGSRNNSSKYKNEIYLVPMIKQYKPNLLFNYVLRTNCFFNDCSTDYVEKFISKLDDNFKNLEIDDVFNDATGESEWVLKENDFNLTLKDKLDYYFFSLKLKMPMANTKRTIDNVIKKTLIDHINDKVKRYNGNFTNNKQIKKERINITKEYAKLLEKNIPKKNEVLNATWKLFLNSGINPISLQYMDKNDELIKRVDIYYPKNINDLKSEPIKLVYLNGHSNKIKTENIILNK